MPTFAGAFQIMRRRIEEENKGSRTGKAIKFVVVGVGPVEGTVGSYCDSCRKADRVVVVKLDVTNEASIKQAAAEVEAKLEGKGLDVLINNAGVCQYAPDGVKSM